MSEWQPTPRGVHRICNMFGDRRHVACGLPDGRYVTAVMAPYTGNRLVAAWWVLTGRAHAVIWPEAGDLEAAIDGAPMPPTWWRPGIIEAPGPGSAA